MILAIAVKATAAMLLALILIRILRRATASLRHSVIAATFGAMLFLPLASMFIPSREVTFKVPRVMRSQAKEIAPVSRGIDSMVVHVAAPRVRIDFARLAVRIYIGGTAFFLLSLLIAIARLHRIAQRARVSVAGTRLAGVAVATSSELTVPITFRSPHPIILLPAESANWSEDDLARVIRHEQEHITRADWVTQIICRVACAIYWPHPLTWLLWRRLRLEAERACDDAVIRTCGDAEPYAEQLVSLARRLVGSVPAPAMATPSSLGRRVEAILDRNVRRAPLTRVTSFAVAITAMLFMLLAAPVTLMSAERGEGSPLITAAARGDVTTINDLLNRRADVNGSVIGDGNALIAAARGGHIDAVRLLLDRGADIDRGVEGDGNPLIMAAGGGHTEVVRYLLDRGATIDKVIEGDENALIGASANGHADVVRLLIERGANVNARVWAEREWRTPLGMVRRNHHDEVVKILVESRASRPQRSRVPRDRPSRRPGRPATAAETAALHYLQIN